MDVENNVCKGERAKGSSKRAGPAENKCKNTVLTISILNAWEPTDSRNRLPPFTLWGAGVIDAAKNVLH